MDNDLSKVTLNKETIDVLVANVIPTTKYFEFRFDTVQKQIDNIETQNNQLRIDMDKRFDSMQTDMDKRFEQMIYSVDRLTDVVEHKDKEQRDALNRLTDVLENKDKEQRDALNRLTDVLENRDKEQRGFTIRMFMISISVSVLGVLGILLKTMGMLD